MKSGNANPVLTPHKHLSTNKHTSNTIKALPVFTWVRHLSRVLMTDTIPFPFGFPRSYKSIPFLAFPPLLTSIFPFPSLLSPPPTLSFLSSHSLIYPHPLILFTQLLHLLSLSLSLPHSYLLHLFLTLPPSHSSRSFTTFCTSSSSSLSFPLPLFHLRLLHLPFFLLPFPSTLSLPHLFLFCLPRLPSLLSIPFPSPVILFPDTFISPALPPSLPFHSLPL